MMKIATICALAMLVPLLPLWGQGDDEEKSGSIPLEIHGFANIFTEGYSMSGEQIARRPGATFRGAGGLTVGYGDLLLESTVLYSTEQNPLLQSLNQVNVGLSFRGATIRYGALFPQYGERVLQGQQITGIELEYNNFGIIFSGITGRNLNAINGDSAEGIFSTYERNISAFRLGIGDMNGSYLTLKGMRAADDGESVSEVFLTLPEENVVAGIAGRLSMMSNSLIFSFEGNASAFNRDRRAEAIDIEGLPSIVEGLFSPTLSSSLGYALSGEANYLGTVFSVTSNLGLVSAGYRSLGVASFFNDQREWSVRPTVRLFNSRLMVQTSLSHAVNNSNNARLSTLERTTGTAGITYMHSSAFTLTSMLMYSRNAAVTELADASTFARNTDILNITLTPTLNYQIMGGTAVTSLTGTFTSIDNTSPDDAANPAGALLQNFNIGLQQSLTVDVLSFSVGGGATFADNFSTIYGMANANFRIEDNIQLTVGAQANSSSGELFSTTMVGGQAGVTYTPWQRHNFTLMGRLSSVTTGAFSFLETTGNLTYAVQF